VNAYEFPRRKEVLSKPGLKLGRTQRGIPVTILNIGPTDAAFSEGFSRTTHEAKHAME
jgi:hypothetical protein